MQLSKNFTLAEMIVSQTAARRGLNNKPGQREITHLRHLCATVLQPLRDNLGRPIMVTSGYRSPAVNAAVGGSATSDHCHGLAADIHVPGMNIRQLMQRVHTLKLPVDQVIDEFGSWLHVACPPPGVIARPQWMQARTVNGRTSYTLIRL